jgi:hypothetical protein
MNSLGKRSNVSEKLKRRMKSMERTFSRNIFAHPQIKTHNLDNNWQP